MTACVIIPGFELRAALRKQPGLALQPAALGPPDGTEPLIGSVTAAAEAAGVRPGMRMGEALAMCPSLVLVEPDPAAAEQAWEEILLHLEDAGLAVDPAEAGCVYFETRGVERLYGGLGKALERALAAVGSTWDPRAGAAERRFTALAAANVARPGQALVVSDDRTRSFLAPLPLTLLSPDRNARGGRRGSSRSGRGSSAAPRGAGRSRCASRRPTSRGCGRRSRRSS